MTPGEPFYAFHKTPSTLAISLYWDFLDDDDDESGVLILLKTKGGWKAGLGPMFGPRTEGKLLEMEKVKHL